MLFKGLGSAITKKNLTAVGDTLLASWILMVGFARRAEIDLHFAVERL